jgi:hypothetical protein
MATLGSPFFLCIIASQIFNMKKFILSIAFAAIGFVASAQEYKVVTIVESIVPGGMGRSRIIETQGNPNLESLTTVRDGNKSNQGKVDRSEAKEAGENLKETKILNFYSLGGINFGNIAANDAVIGAKISEMVQQGWALAFVTSAVESDAGKSDGVGIFITRLFFVKNK